MTAKYSPPRDGRALPPQDLGGRVGGHPRGAQAPLRRPGGAGGQGNHSDDIRDAAMSMLIELECYYNDDMRETQPCPLELN